MQCDSRTSVPTSSTQFSLAELFEYITVCAVPLAFSRILGLASSMLLMAMGLALGLRQGTLALALFIAAVLVADVRFSSIDSTESFWRQSIVALMATALCTWYKARRQNEGSRGFD